jgi:hypothetical protein
VKAAESYSSGLCFSSHIMANSYMLPDMANMLRAVVGGVGTVSTPTGQENLDQRLSWLVFTNRVKTTRLTHEPHDPNRDCAEITVEGGGTYRASSLISAAGYKYSQPKMSVDLKWKKPSWLICDNLYKGIFNVKEPNIMYVGMQH